MLPPLNVWEDTQHDQQKWRLHLSNHTFYFIIVTSWPPLSSRMPRNSSSFCSNAGLNVGSNQRTTPAPSTALVWGVQVWSGGGLNLPFRCFRWLSCIQALIQVSELSVVLGFCGRLGVSDLHGEQINIVFHYYSSQLLIFYSLQSLGLMALSSRCLSRCPDLLLSSSHFGSFWYSPHRGTSKACQISAWVLLLVDGGSFFFTFYSWTI